MLSGLISIAVGPQNVSQHCGPSVVHKKIAERAVIASVLRSFASKAVCQIFKALQSQRNFGIARLTFICTI